MENAIIVLLYVVSYIAIGVVFAGIYIRFDRQQLFFITENIVSWPVLLVGFIIFLIGWLTEGIVIWIARVGK